MKLTEIVANGARYQLNLPESDSDYIQKSIASTGRPYEEAMLIDIADGISAGDLVLDVGANCGNHALYLSCVAGAEVHAFEPDAELCELIRTSASINGVESLVTVHEVGVGDADGFGRIVQTAENNRGAQRLQKVSSEEDSAVIIRLDALELTKPVRVLKIDVEGMELDVLNGAKNLIERDLPEVYVECQTRSDFERINTWLAKFGYVYLSTFNATPTHRFGPSELAVDGSRLEQVVKHQVAATYYDQKLISELRQSLSEANLKYRGVTAQLSPLNEQLRLANAASARQDELIQRLETDLSASTERGRQLEENLAEERLTSEGLREQFAALKTEERGLVEQIKTLSSEADDLRRKLHHEQGLMAAAVQERTEAIEKLSSTELRLTEQATRFEEERRSWNLDLDHTKMQLSGARRDATFKSMKLRLALRRARVDASKLQEISTQLLEAEAELEQSKLASEGALGQLVKERGMVSRLQRALDEANRGIASLNTALIEEQSKTAEARALVRATGEELTQRQRQAESLESAVVRAEAEIATVYADADRLRLELALADDKLRSLRSSVTYRLGQLIRDSVQTPRGLATLPVRVGRLVREYQSRRVSEEAVAGQIVAIEDGLDLDAQQPSSPTNRAAELRAERLLPSSVGTAALQLSTSSDRRMTRVAAIMDEFTVQSFTPECELLELSVDNYLDELNAFAPSIVFLESAWRGKGDEWGNKVAQTSGEIREIVAWAHTAGVPVILWNKEDPVHYSTFLNTAKLVDHVFTTDIDCVQRYKSDLGHDRVHFLPFACQPVLHSPLEIFDRSHGMCFAGAYYRRYPDRTKDLESFMAHIPRFAPLEIFDRNFGKTDKQYAFPKEYQAQIVGTLSSSEIDLAYKGYDYAINLNSVKESQSMFARRVYELLASNTIVVSNYSRGLQLLFGDIPVIADSGSVVVDKLQSTGQVAARLRRLAGLRKVMQEHTYSHRLKYVLNQVGLTELADDRPAIQIFGLVSSPSQVLRLKEAADRQTGVAAVLRLFTENGDWLPTGRTVHGIAIEDVTAVRGQPLAGAVHDNIFVAFMHHDDYYGPHYLLDLALGRVS